jgi:hypothetical protein
LITDPAIYGILGYSSPVVATGTNIFGANYSTGTMDNASDFSNVTSIN